MNKSNKFLQIIWFLTLLAIFFLFIGIWVGTLTTSDKLENTIISERNFNAIYAPNIDKNSWESRGESQFFGWLSDKVSLKISSSKNIVENQQGVIENIWNDTALNAHLYAMLLDYRLQIAIIFLPLLIILFLSSLLDAINIRKIQKYRNSFSSPLKQHIGGQLIGLNLSYLLIILFFLPLAIPAWVFLSVILMKIFGWWLWIISLPKRM